MPLNLIIGKSNSGKSKYIFESMLEKTNEKKHAILFVPKMARIVTEKEYMSKLNVNGITDVTITTIDRFISKALEQTDIYDDKDFLPEMSKKMYMKEFISKYKEDFNIFAKTMDSKSFVNLLCIYFDLFEKEGLSIENIEKLYKEEDFTKAKLKELLNVYEKIQEKRQEKFIDSIDETKYYISTVLKAEKTIWKDKDIYFDSYNNFSKSEYALIQEFLRFGANVTITLNMPKPSEDLEFGIFEESYITYKYLKDLAENVGARYSEIYLDSKEIKQKEDLEFLTNNIFSETKEKYRGKESNVILNIVSNPYEEIKYIAEEIKENITGGNYRYKDFVIFTSNIDSYYLTIKRVFEEYNIPVFLNSKTDIKNSKIARYITLILDIVINGFEYRKHTKLIELLKLGFWDLDKEHINEFENYINELDIKGYMLNKEFTKNVNEQRSYSYNLENVNKVRTYAINKINSISSKINKCNNSKDITSCLFEILNEDEVITKYEEHIQNIKTENLEEGKRQVQILTNIYSIMDNICLVTEEITLEEYLELLNFGLEENTVSTIPALIDEVEVCDINKTRNEPKKIAFIIGANEGSMPSENSQDATFTEVELDKLKNVGISIRKTTAEKINMELFNIYSAISKVCDKLVVTIPSSKITGESLRISTVVNEIKDILNIEIQSIDKITKREKNELFKNTLEDIRKIEDLDKEGKTRLITEYTLLKNSEKYNKLYSYSRLDNDLDKKITDKIYNKNINLSVSRLESLKKCPFAYLSKYILRLQEKQSYELSKMDLGSIMHLILEKISRYIMAKNLSWEGIIQEEKTKALIEKEIERIVNEIFEQEYSKQKDSVRLDVMKISLKRSLLKIVCYISESINQSAFKPIGYEIEFDKTRSFCTN